MSVESVLSSWRTRRVRKRAEGDARELIDQARGILKKKSHRIPDAVTAEIEQAIAALEAAMSGDDLEAVKQGIVTLDRKMDDHLAFARKSRAREYIESIGVAIGIALFLRAFVVEAFQIPSGSMIPTLEIGDHIFVSKFSYGIGIPFTDKKILELAEPKRGDVIVFKYPLGPETDYIKRVVALPGETIEVRRNEIWIDGKPLPREQAPEPCRHPDVQRPCITWIERANGGAYQVIHEIGRGPGADARSWKVPADHVFVMGDNRDNSNDSRVWEFVPYKLIKGRALIVWWSRGTMDREFSWAPTELPGSVASWFDAIRFRRFFHLVE